MKLLRTEKKLCVCCMEEHDIKTVSVLEKTLFKNVVVNYVAEYFYCDVAEELYMNERMMEQNNIKMKDAYNSVVVMNISNKEIVEAIAEVKQMKQNLSMGKSYANVDDMMKELLV